MEDLRNLDELTCQLISLDRLTFFFQDRSISFVNHFSACKNVNGPPSFGEIRSSGYCCVLQCYVLAVFMTVLKENSLESPI